MSRSAADIVSLSSARETLFIGPPAAFPVQARRLLLRDRLSAREALAAFLSRPGAEELLRPYLRRWSIDTGAIRSAGRGELADMLSRAAGSGTIAVALAPDPVVAFSRAAGDFDARIRRALQQGDDAPPADDVFGRLLALARVVPSHLDGTARQEFEALRQGGEAALLAGLAAMTVPGVNIAILGMSLFTLPGSVLEAIERLSAILDDVRRAPSADGLQGLAGEAAGVLTVLMREGILRRYVDTRFVIKGMPAAGRFGKPVR